MKDWIKIMKNLNENKNGRVVTFDFDNTIVKSFENNKEGMGTQYEFGGLNKAIIQRIKKFKDSGVTVFIVTSRNVAMEDPENSVQTIIDKLNIKVDGIFYTNGDKKAKKLYELGSSLHYDDDPQEAEAIKAYSQLHKNFDIVVKNPEDLLSDTEEVSKGLIVTSDGKFIIVQRSDSYEWDAAGGHLLQGETPSFAFWREVKEETQLKIINVQHLDSRDTTWKKQKKLVHYFIASTEVRSDDLQGSIHLQWELEDYFCGDMTEIYEQMQTPDGATENLKNVVDLLLEQQEVLLMERKIKNYQQDSPRLADYDRDAHELLGTGPQTKGWGTGIKNVKVKKGKSAPPGAPGGGWGAIGEEKGDKPRRKIKIRFISNLEEKKGRKKT
tara:strand:+ start:1718 stop:2866 length:1149 start_codon:yes stop_codon:yes gene_type:complete